MMMMVVMMVVMMITIMMMIAFTNSPLISVALGSQCRYKQIMQHHCRRTVMMGFTKYSSFFSLDWEQTVKPQTDVY
jgi:hypothetical protein